MRWIENIPNKNFTINLYHHQERYILKFEAGPMEQTYKIPQGLRPDAEAVKKLLTPEFLEEVRQQFNAMYVALKKQLDAK
ncbi:hypothetical protein HZ996_11545 [Cryomorphaceae bacterium]|nr:hypothetical protein HZ996_11545 [Cryomorphaceae bacterium]